MRGRQAAMKRKLLCSFHFFERFPEVSSQYSQIGKAATREPCARARQRLPILGSVNVHGSRVLVIGLKMSGENVLKVSLLSRMDEATYKKFRSVQGCHYNTRVHLFQALEMS